MRSTATAIDAFTVKVPVREINLFRQMSLLTRLFIVKYHGNSVVITEASAELKLW